MHHGIHEHLTVSLPASAPSGARSRRAGETAWRAEVIARALERGQHVHVFELGGGISCPGGECSPADLEHAPSARGVAGTAAEVR